MKKRLKLIIGSLFLSKLPLLMAGTVYQGIDDNGQVIFSDKPLANSKKITVQPLQTYSPVPTISILPSSTSTNKATIEYQITLISPAPHETFTTDKLTIPVTVALSPALQATDKIQLLLNQQPQGEPSAQMHFTLEKLARGTYQLQARVLGEDGQIKAQSQTITFYQKRNFIRKLHRKSFY